MIIIAKEKDRLDSIVFEHYNTLEVMPQVLEVNTSLYDTIELAEGTEVILPDIANTPTLKDEKSLWLATT